jgi:hypothetical protein
VIDHTGVIEGAEPMELDQLTRRLATAEQEIARAHAEIAVIRQHCKRLGRARILAGISVTIAGTAIAGLMSTASTAAQGGAQKLTVKAPFTVVDSQNKPLLVVDDGGRRGLSVIGTDGNAFSGLFDEQTVVRAPFLVLDTASKPIATVQNSTTSQIKDAKGEKKEVTTNRGLHVFNDNGDAVGRVAVLDGSGYVGARQTGQGTGTGGVQALLTATKDGTAIWLVNNAKHTSVGIESNADGLRFMDDDGTVRAQVTASKIWLGNKEGDGVVEAGALPDGRGVVRTGPRNGGPLGMGTLNLPWAITGHK